MPEKTQVKDDYPPKKKKKETSTFVHLNSSNSCFQCCQDCTDHRKSLKTLRGTFYQMYHIW